MPGSDTLIVVSQERLEALTAAFAAPRPEESWIRNVFGEFGVEFDAFWEPDRADELRDSEESRVQVFNGALAALLGEGECLDTSIDLLLSVVSKGNPELQALREFFADLDFDVELPSSVRPVEYGLLGVWSAAKIGPAFAGARRFATRDGVAEYFAERAYSLLERGGGLPARHRALQTEWLSEDFWNTWEELVQALARAVDEGSYLALVAWD